MGLFDGVSLKGIVRDVTNVVGAFTGAAPIQDQQPVTVQQTSPGWIPGKPPTTVDTYDPYTERESYFGEILPGILRTLPVFNQSQETKVSGEKTMENGPQVYQGSAAIIPFAREAAKIGRSIFGGGAGGAVGGAVTGYGVGQMLAGGDQCGCGTKPFVRLDKCGRPIITRSMQKKAKEMVQNCGMEAAAQMLGVDIQLLGEIAFKQFKPRAKGISGAQMKTTKRVNRQIMKYSKELKKSCK
jgi:hypothetical protein